MEGLTRRVRPAAAFLCGLALALAWPARADEHKFDFSTTPTNQAPAGSHSVVAGDGKPGDWRVLLDEVPDDAPAFLTNAPRMTRKSVVGQLARDTTDEHYPVLILSDEVFSNFTFTTRFKLVAGETEEMAGVAFRIQDAKNFYVVRASGLGNTLYFYRFEKGLRTPPSGNNMTIEKGVWHELSVECEGTKILVKLDGRQALPEIDDPTFAAGKVGFWTKSDSVSYFADARISYASREKFAQRMVREAMKDYPRLLGVKVYAPDSSGSGTLMIASDNEKEIGKAGVKSDSEVIRTGINYYLNDSGQVTVTMPLSDRNGDPVAAVRVVMKAIVGQTQDNALNRAVPVVKAMQQKMSLVSSITE